jgi:hypothetical protein
VSAVMVCSFGWRPGSAVVVRGTALTLAVDLVSGHHQTW